MVAFTGPEISAAAAGAGDSSFFVSVLLSADVLAVISGLESLQANYKRIMATISKCLIAAYFYNGF
jgi:hypothetical protein